MNWLSYLRNCKGCGLGFGSNNFTPIDFFCDDCWLALERYKTQNHFLIYKTPSVRVRSLFIWKEKDCLVQDLIHGLKGGTPRDVIHQLTLELSKRYSVDNKTVIIPVPSSKVGESDHAKSMAEIISKDHNLELWDGLRWRRKTRNQKFLNKTERFVAEMILVEKLPINKRVILIDDLVTTGATAQAALKALKGLNNIEVWSLACRL